MVKRINEVQKPRTVEQLIAYILYFRGIEHEDFRRRPEGHGQVQKYLLLRNTQIITGPLAKFKNYIGPKRPDGMYLKAAETEVTFGECREKYSSDLVILTEDWEDGKVHERILHLVEVKTVRPADVIRRGGEGTIAWEQSSHHRDSSMQLKRANEFYTDVNVKKRLVEVPYFTGENPPTISYNGKRGRKRDVKSRETHRIRHPLNHNTLLTLEMPQITICGVFDVTDEVLGTNGC